MRSASAPYPRYRWITALTLAVVVVSSAVTIKDDEAQASSANALLRPATVVNDWSLAISQIGSNRKSAAAGPSNLPLEAQSSLSRVLGRDLHGYQARAQGSRFAAENARNNLGAEFTPAGVEMRSRNALWKLALRSYGYGNALQAVPTAIPHASSKRVEYRHGTLTEWYVNEPLGLEQGFTLNQRPVRPAGPVSASFRPGNMQLDGRQSTIGNSPSQPLNIVLALSGNLVAIVDQGRTGLTLTNGDGRAELRYTGLIAYDSTGKHLRAWLELQGEQLLLKVDDATARYPVVIDPWVQLAKLTASDGHAGDFLGSSVAIDANTVVAGAVPHTGAPGAAYVFVKPATGWANITETAKLTASDGDPFLGSSVAVSSNTIVAVGISGAYVFVKPDTGWRNMTETAKLTASDPEGPASLGFSVAITGNTVVAGNPNATSGAGAAYVWVKPASGWTNAMQTARLTASDGGGNLGFSMAISSSTIIAGAPGANSSQGAAYVFVEPSSGWADVTQTAKLTASDGGGSLAFSVGIDGNTVVAGRLSGATGTAAYVFVEPAAGWADMTETAKLTASDQALVEFGFSVAISGNTVVVGAPPDPFAGNPDLGAAYVFVEAAMGWANMTETAKLISLDGAAGDLFGVSAAITGNTVVAGDPVPRTSVGEAKPGAAYVFSVAVGIPFSRFGGSLLIDPDAGIFYLSGGFTLGAGGSIDPSAEPVTFSVGSYSVTLPPGSFVKYKTGYVYQKTVNHIFLCVYIKFTSTPGTYQLLANRRGGTLSTSTSPVPVTLTIGNDSGTAQMNAKFD